MSPTSRIRLAALLAAFVVPGAAAQAPSFSERVEALCPLPARADGAAAASPSDSVLLFDHVMQGADMIVNPREVMQRQLRSYPRLLLDAGIEGQVWVCFLVAETGASSVKDMGRVMALMKERHAGQLDMSKASHMVKARLS